MAAMHMAYRRLTWNQIDEALRDFYGNHKDTWRKLRKEYNGALFAEMEAFTPPKGHQFTESYRQKALKHIPAGVRKIAEQRFPNPT